MNHIEVEYQYRDADNYKNSEAVILQNKHNLDVNQSFEFVSDYLEDFLHEPIENKVLYFLHDITPRINSLLGFGSGRDHNLMEIIGVDIVNRDNDSRMGGDKEDLFDLVKFVAVEYCIDTDVSKDISPQKLKLFLEEYQASKLNASIPKQA